MHQCRKLILVTLLFAAGLINSAYAFTQTELSVWVNEATIAVNTYDFKNFIPRQKEIAKYFSGTGWINYSKAFNDSGLPKLVQTKNYEVTAVATLPPTIKKLSERNFQASMPVLLLFSNPEHKQKQNLLVTIHFETAQNGQGIRGLNITSYESKTTEPPCECKPVINEMGTQ